MADSTEQPTIRQGLLLYLAHYILTDGKPPEPRYDLQGKPTFTVTPLDMESRASSWLYDTYGKGVMAPSLSREWRRLREPPQEDLKRMGLDVQKRTPTEKSREPASFNAVWDITVHEDRFNKCLEDQRPFTDYAF